MPGRSPHRRSPPPPPLISRHTSPRGRARSPPERHHLEMPSSSRGRERREYRPTVRRSRSPVLSKGRSLTPPTMKRKVSPPREREISRRTKLSKSPVSARVGSEHRTFGSLAPDTDSHTVRTVSGSERFRDRDYEPAREREGPQFRGPEGSVNFDINELKKFTIEIVRKTSGVNDEPLNRNITNPEDIVPVRRPDEGVRPMFMRAGIASSSKDRSVPPDDYRRIVAIDSSRVSGGHERERSRERRYSPAPYDDSRRPYYHERERGSYESRHHSPPPREEYIEPREVKRERRASSRDDLRHNIDVRRKEERRYSQDRSSYERDSDLRTRINEKRSEPHVERVRVEEREHSSRRYESERERHGRSHHSPALRERKRGGSVDRHEGSRPSRGEWEREREGGSERRKRPHSRDREERGRDRYEHSEHYDESERSKPPRSYKTEYEPKKFYKSYEDKEFIPPSNRGRGGPPIRRGMPPGIVRGRGIPRGINRGFRGMMGGVPRGLPRPFMGMRGFPPRFFPPY